MDYAVLSGWVCSVFAILIEMSDKVWGYCYTQLTDVEQEQNGIYYYDRGTKYDMERVKAIFQMALPEQK